jgi:hypothetical protein
VKVTFYCEVDLTYFPFDEQVCRLRMESWSLTDANLILKWLVPKNGIKPIEVSEEFFMSEYELKKILSKEAIFDYRHIQHVDVDPQTNNRGIEDKSSGGVRKRTGNRGMVRREVHGVHEKSRAGVTGNLMSLLDGEEDLTPSTSLAVGVANPRVLFKEGKITSYIYLFT